MPSPLALAAEATFLNGLARLLAAVEAPQALLTYHIVRGAPSAGCEALLRRGAGALLAGTAEPGRSVGLGPTRTRAQGTDDGQRTHSERTPRARARALSRGMQP